MLLLACIHFSCQAEGQNGADLSAYLLVDAVIFSSSKYYTTGFLSVPLVALIGSQVRGGMGGHLVDTPGFSYPSLDAVSSTDLASFFPEMRELIESEGPCRFR